MHWHFEFDGDDTDMANVGGIYFWTQKDFNTLMGTLASMQGALISLQASVNLLLTTERQHMSALDDLTTQVTANTNLEQSAITLIQGIAQQLQTAIANNDSAALNTLAQQLNTSAAALGAAISANTAAPAPDPNAPVVNPLHR